MTDQLDEIVERITPVVENRSLNIAMHAVVKQAIESLAPEDLDTLAQRLGFELARKTDDRCSSRFDTNWLEGYTEGWNDRHEKMMSWREAEVDGERSP